MKLVFNEFWRYIPDQYKLSENSSVKESEAFTITVANIRQYGNDAFIAPNAKMDDGVLDLTVIKPFPKHQFLNIGLILFNQSLHKCSFVYSKRIKRVRIENKNADCYHLDGEHFHLLDGELNIEVIPKCLKVIVP